MRSSSSQLRSSSSDVRSSRARRRTSSAFPGFIFPTTPGGRSPLRSILFCFDGLDACSLISNWHLFEGMIQCIRQVPQRVCPPSEGVCADARSTLRMRPSTTCRRGGGCKTLRSALRSRRGPFWQWVVSPFSAPWSPCRSTRSAPPASIRPARCEASRRSLCVPARSLCDVAHRGRCKSAILSSKGGGSGTERGLQGNELQ